MNTPNVHAGRLERRVRRVGRKIRPGLLGFCSLPYPYGAIRGKPLLRPTALVTHSAQYSAGPLLRPYIYGPDPNYPARMMGFVPQTILLH